MLENQRILGISGRKQSGKDTTCNFLHSLAIFHHKISPRAFIDEVSGKLIVQTGPNENDLGILDLDNKDPEYLDWAEKNLYPFVKSYSMADNLKWFCVNFAGLLPEQVWGTDEQKNTLTKYKWEDMPVPPEYYSEWSYS